MFLYVSDGRVEVCGVLHSSCSCMFLMVEWRCVGSPLFMFLYVSDGRVEVRGVLHSLCSCMFLTVEWRCVVCSTLHVFVCFSQLSGGAWCVPLFVFLYVSHGRVEVRGVLHSSCSYMFLTVEWRCVVCSTLHVLVCF